VRREAFDGEGTRHADAGVVGVGFVVEIFEVGLGRDGDVDFFLPGDSRLPPVGVEVFGLR